MERVKIVNGDILNCTEDIICQQVNCQGVMGSGLARQLRDKYPKMFVQYKSWCKFAKTPEALLGNVHFYYHDPYDTGYPVKVIANIFGQLTYGRVPNTIYTDYEALATGFLKVSQMARETKKTTAIPYGMGAGLAGGDWGTVLAMIESRETFINKFVTIYRLDK